MKKILYGLAAITLLLTGCVDPVMQQYEAQRQQDALARQQYLAAHPDLSENDKWYLQNGIQTPAEIESHRVRRQALLEKQHTERQKYIDAHSGLSPEICSAILAGRVIVGMKADEVLASWQTDQWTLVDSADFEGVSISDWKLGDTFVTIKNGSVFSVSYIPQ